MPETERRLTGGRGGIGRVFNPLSLPLSPGARWMFDSFVAIIIRRPCARDRSSVITRCIQCREMDRSGECRVGGENARLMVDDFWGIDSSREWACAIFAIFGLKIVRWRA